MEGVLKQASGSNAESEYAFCGDAPSRLTEMEIEFLAEATIVTILPSFNLPALDFVSEQYGPFRAQVPVEVPLWVALNLKQSRRCRIQPPSWLDTERLGEALKLAKEELQVFVEMPEHFITVAHLLLKHAAEDLQEPRQIRSILSSLESVRDSKIREGFNSFNSEFKWAKLNNLSHMEINKIRPYIITALDGFAVLRDENQEPEASQFSSRSQTQSQSQSDSQSSSFSSARPLRAFRN